jgi:hypothetical protein
VCVYINKSVNYVRHFEDDILGCDVRCVISLVSIKGSEERVTFIIRVKYARNILRVF